MLTMYNPLRSKTGDHAYLAYQGSSKIRWPPKKGWPCLLCLLGVSLYKKQKNTNYLNYQNGHHVYALPLKTGDHANIGYHWSHFVRNIKTQTLWSLKMVTMYNPLRSKTGDHAYLAYQGSSKIRWPPKKRWPCLLWLLGVSFNKNQKNTKYLKYQNGHQV